MITPGAHTLKLISGFLFLWAVASTTACFLLLASQQSGTIPGFVTNLRSKLSGDIFDSQTFGSGTGLKGNEGTEMQRGIHGPQRRATIESEDADEDEGDRVGRSSGGLLDGDGTSDARNKASEKGTASRSKSVQAASDADSEETVEEENDAKTSNPGQGSTDESREEDANKERRKEEIEGETTKLQEADAVDELIKGVQQTLAAQGSRKKRLSKASTSDDEAYSRARGGRLGGESASRASHSTSHGLGSLAGNSERHLSVPLSSCDTFVALDRKPHDPWVSLKHILPPASCKVQGLAIEELDPRYNFRRGFALGFTEDAEDKTHLLPYLRAAQDISLHTRPRRVLLDLGADKFRMSTSWFLRYYPLDFTEVHAFEMRKGRFRIPGRAARAGVQAQDEADETPGRRSRARGQLHRSEDAGAENYSRRRLLQDSDGGDATEVTGGGLRLLQASEQAGEDVEATMTAGRLRRRQAVQDAAMDDGGVPKHLDTWSRSRPAHAGPWPIPKWQLDRIHLHEKIVAPYDGQREVNITRFIKEELGLRPSDSVVIKIDIDYSEWFILPAWLRDLEMPFIVDDLFVKFHYSHRTMEDYGWTTFKKRRPKVVKFLTQLRQLGFYAHYWP